MSTPHSPTLPTTISFDEAGFADVPPNLLVTIETSLERATLPTPQDHPIPAGFKLAQPDPADLDAFKTLFREVGNPWLWYGRVTKSDDAIRAILAAPTTTLRYLHDAEGRAVGLFEAQQQGDDTLEVTYFGLVPQMTGRRLGQAMMEHGVAAAWQPGITRTWLHTCTFDSPQALSFYRRCGFKPFRQRVELAPDPRLTGALPRETAPHIPLADFSDV